MIIKNSTSSEKITFDIDEIDLKEIFTALWHEKVLIIAITTCFAIFSVFYSLSLTDIYKSEAVLTVDDSNSGPSLVGGLGGLASMAGVNLSSGSGSKKFLAIETIKSRAFLEHLVKFDNILPSIMAAKSYDKQSKKIEFNQDVYNEDTGQWVTSLEKKQAKPSYLKVYPNYISLVTITDQDFITISVEHMSPVFAKELLDLIIKETNELLRKKDLRESSNAIEFLTTELSKSSLISMKDAMNELVQSKLEMQMMAKISSDYVLKIVDPPYIPEEKFGPARAIICISGTLFGGLLSILLILIRRYTF
jgi:uncharacterized protein involved in exopolysaccharide biosynthesis